MWTGKAERPGGVQHLDPFARPGLGPDGRDPSLNSRCRKTNAGLPSGTVVANHRYIAPIDDPQGGWVLAFQNPDPVPPVVEDCDGAMELVVLPGQCHINFFPSGDCWCRVRWWEPWEDPPCGTVGIEPGTWGSLKTLFD